MEPTRQQPTSASVRPDRTPSRSKGYFRSGRSAAVVGVAGLTFIPAVIILSAITLVFLAWPVFLGGYLTYGLLPHQPSGPLRLQSSEMLVHWGWYALNAAWLALLVTSPMLIGRIRTRLESRRIETTVEEVLTPDNTIDENVVTEPRAK